MLLDNAGGAVFDRLPIAAQTDVYEHHIATPTGLDFERAAGLYGLDYLRPETLGDLRAALAAPAARARLVHVIRDRAAALALHDAVAGAASAALTRAAAAAPRA